MGLFLITQGHVIVESLENADRKKKAKMKSGLSQRTHISMCVFQSLCIQMSVYEREIAPNTLRNLLTHEATSLISSHMSNSSSFTQYYLTV